MFISHALLLNETNISPTAMLVRLMLCIVLVGYLIFKFVKRRGGLYEKIFPIRNDFAKRSPGNGIYSAPDYNLVFENKAIIGILEIGQLNLPTGQIVACDPLVPIDMRAFHKSVPPGKYPVKLYAAKRWYDNFDVYAFAKLEFKPDKADKWELAIKEGEDISTLKHGEYFGFAVDSGTASFFDHQTGPEYNKWIDGNENANPAWSLYDDFFMKEVNDNFPDHWINFNIPNTELNITMFGSGTGDGVYPAYWGMTNDNEIVSLLIDFQVLSIP